LDGKALVEEYRLHQERPSEGMLEPIVAPSQRNRSRSRQGGSGGGPSRGYALAVGTIVTIIVVLVVLLATGGGGGPGKSPSAASTRHTTKPTKTKKPANGHGSARASNIVALSLTPTGPVYVCLAGEDGHLLIPGEELQPGHSTATYHARHFDLTLGNNAVTLYIDGRPRPVPASAQAIGYSITKARGRQPLPASQQPACR